MSETVWVIEQGSYSDYRVVGVFSSRESAERIAAKINGAEPSEDAEVAEWPLDPGVDALNQGLTAFHVLMLYDGTVERLHRKENPWSYVDLASRYWIWERTKAPAYRDKGIPDALDASVWASDEEHAVKSTNEVRLQMIASGKWRAPGRKRTMKP